MVINEHFDWGAGLILFYTVVVLILMFILVVVGVVAGHVSCSCLLVVQGKLQ
jgi:hypothetical protein